MSHKGGCIKDRGLTKIFLLCFGLILSLVLFLSFFVFKNFTHAKDQSVKTQADEKIIDFFTEKNIFKSPDPLVNQNQDILVLDKQSTNSFVGEKIYTSDPIKSDFPFNAYTLNWKDEIPNKTDIIIESRASTDGINWGKWRNLRDPGAELDDDGRDDGIGVVDGKNGAYTYGDLFFPDKNSGTSQFIQFRATLKSFNQKLTPSLDEVIVKFINTLSKKDVDGTRVHAASAPSIISRAGWGANESWRNWAPEYAVPKNFFIHHTVTMNNDPNPPATVRAIYYYHAVVRGWGDIGYNYLVDQYGNIYEGRYGGNGVVGGHVSGYNYGSIGVSLLGDFHPGSEDRGNGSPYLSSAAKNKLADLIAYKGAINGINPTGTWVADGAYPGVKNNVAGHRDAGATSCPGDYLYAALPAIRQNAYNKYIQFQDLKLIKIPNQPEIYLVVPGTTTIRHISSIDVFNAWGFKWNTVGEVEKLDGYTVGEPLGLLLRKIGGTAIYYMENGYRRLIPDELAWKGLNFSEDDILDLPNYLAGSYGNGPVLHHLVKEIGSDEIYLLVSGKRYHIPSVSVFYNWNFSWIDVSLVDQGFKDQFSDGGVLSNLSKKISGEIYLLDKGIKIYIPSSEIFYAWNFNWDKVIILPDYFLDHFQISPQPLSYLAKIYNRPEVYAVDDGIKWHIRDTLAFSQWGFHWQDVKELSSQTVDVLTYGGKITHIVKKDGTEEIYLVDKQQLRHIPSMEIFNIWGFSWSDVAILPGTLVDKYTTLGTPLSFLVKGSGPEIYALDGNKKYWISNPESFNAWNFNWDQVALVSQNFINGFINGGTISPAEKIVKVASDDAFDILNNQNQKLNTAYVGEIVRASYNEGNYFIKKNDSFFKAINLPIRFLPKDPANHQIRVLSYDDIPSWDPSLNDNIFRGLIEINYSSTSNKIWIINDLSIEDYIKGVAETSLISPFEHLKTMSVTARSYAYYHLSHGGKYPNEPFHLKNSRFGNGDDQVYKGYGLEARFSDLVSAVNQTSGKVVTYGGNPVITPYFSQSDGRTRSWEEVWGGTTHPWCVSVSDPDSNGMTKLGHGVGLPGYGAMKRAERGDSYQTILAYYYRGSALGNISNPNIRIAIYGI